MARAASGGSGAASLRRNAEQAVIGRGARLRGRINGDGDLRVEGQVAGDVSVRGDLAVGTDGEIAATEVQASSIAIEGVVEGDIVATDSVAIGPRARVAGTIRSAGVSIEEGAQIAARLEAEFELPPELLGRGAR